MTFLNNQFDIILHFLYLLVSIMIVLCFCLHYGLSGKHKFINLMTPMTFYGVLILTITLILVLNNPFGNQFLFLGIFVQDDFVLFIQSIIIFVSLLILISSHFYFKEEKYNSFEPIILMLIAVFSMCALVSSFDLLAIYLCIELQSFCFYILAAIRRKNIYSIEAGIKYFILGSFSSSFLIFGFSLLYGFTGLTNLEDLITFFSQFTIYNQTDILFQGHLEQLTIGVSLAIGFIFVDYFSRFMLHRSIIGLWIFIKGLLLL
jgi:NADH:ubiquinone oxidoreductase subunit 2 (subunit N)